MQVNNSFVTVNSIFQKHWKLFSLRHKDLLRQVEIDEVGKMLTCKGSSRGCSVWYCKKCDTHHVVRYGCNSRICSSCGKRHADNWSEKLASNTFDVPHKHFTMTLSDLLWEPIRNDRGSLKVLMDSAIQTITEFYENVFGKEIIPGCIVVLHPFGRDIKFDPHIHVIATKGGFDSKGIFQEWTRFIPYKILHKKWMAIVCKNLKEYFPNTQDFVELFRLIWALFRDTGFVVDVSKETIRNRKHMARYIARYVRHPAIADSRIVELTDDSVLFYYIDHKTKKKIYKRMVIEEFMLAIIQHIPEKQFKMIRYYGAYSRNQKRKYKRYLKSSIRQKKLLEFGGKKVLNCPKCGNLMGFVEYFKGEPPPEPEITLLDFS